MAALGATLQWLIQWRTSGGRTKGVGDTTMAFSHCEEEGRRC